MRNIFFLILCVLGYQFSNAQNSGTYGDKFSQGNALFLKKNYAAALPLFQQAYAADSSGANINYKIGACLVNIGGKGIVAAGYLGKAVKNVTKDYDQNSSAEKAAPPMAYYYLGRAYQQSYHFSEASANYKIYKTYIAGDKAQMEEVSHRITQCNTAKMFIMAPNNARLINMGDSVNSKYSDYGALVSQDGSTAIFTSRRQGKNAQLMPDGEYHASIYISYGKPDSSWSAAHLYSASINALADNATCAISPDGQVMLLSCNDGKSGALYQTRMGENDWDAPVKLASDINTTGNTSGACISPDGNTLYFVSDRPGGMGGKDIWRCVKLPNGNWSRSLDLGEPINTPYDEESPFLHWDGRTFFFSSEGHNSMGGYDIFFSQLLDSGKFSEPFNLGYPINTPDNELNFTLGPDGKKGYLNSDRSGGKGGQDLYMVIMPHASERPLTVIKGQILAAPGEELSDDVHIIATDKASNQEVGDFKPIKATGKFTIIVPPGRTYILSYQDDDKEFYNEVIDVPADAGYKEIHKELTLSPHSIKGPDAPKKDGQ